MAHSKCAADPEKLARLRVYTGVRWLNRHAPIEWRVLMCEYEGNQLISLVDLLTAKENPLELAFQHWRRQHPKGVSIRAAAQIHFCLSAARARGLGFLASTPEDSRRLNRVWQEELCYRSISTP